MTRFLFFIIVIIIVFITLVIIIIILGTLILVITLKYLILENIWCLVFGILHQSSLCIAVPHDAGWTQTACRKRLVLLLRGHQC